MTDSRPAEPPKTAPSPDLDAECVIISCAFVPLAAFWRPRHFLHADILRTMPAPDPATARVPRSRRRQGETLAGRQTPSPRHRRVPEAVLHARPLDRAMTITLADALTFQSPSE